MKKYRFLFVIGIALLPLLYGCPDTKNITTTINSDGSCTRTIGEFNPEKFKGIDSIKYDIPIPVDESWELININDSTAVLKKDFGSVAELNESYAYDESELRMYQRRVELEKKFRWFHTVFEYRETYDGLLTEIPFTNYFNEEEAEVFKSDNSEDHPLLANLDKRARNSLTDNIEMRFGLWLHDNIYSMEFDDILEISDSLGLIDLNKVNVKAVKDTVKHMIDQDEKQLMSFDDNQLGPVEMARIIGVELGLDSISLSKLAGDEELATLDEKYENWLLADIATGHNNQVIMPGQLIDTNAELVQGDTLEWHMSSIKFINADYAMFAESRVTNNWAYIVSGFILAMAIIIPFLKREKV